MLPRCCRTFRRLPRASRGRRAVRSALATGRCGLFAPARRTAVPPAWSGSLGLGTAGLNRTAAIVKPPSRTCERASRTHGHGRSYYPPVHPRTTGAPREHERGGSPARLYCFPLVRPSRARQIPRLRPSFHPRGRLDGQAPPDARATQQGPVLKHVRPPPRPLLPRHRHRPRHRQHARPCPRPRHRHLRAVGRRDRRQDEAGPGDRRRGEAHGRPDAGLDHRRPPAPRRGHQRLRRDRADDQVLRQQGARPDRADPAAPDAARASRRASPRSRSGPSATPRSTPAPAGPA